MSSGRASRIMEKAGDPELEWIRLSGVKVCRADLAAQLLPKRVTRR
jgi:hypothetical protein